MTQQPDSILASRPNHLLDGVEFFTPEQSAQHCTVDKLLEILLRAKLQSAAVIYEASSFAGFLLPCGYL